MNSATRPQVPKSSLSAVTERSADSNAVIALGRKLVTELGLGTSVDTLGRWMVHHIADTIHQVESSEDSERPAKEAQLRDLVLALWAHRSAMPGAGQLFKEFEPILRALTSLDPESPTWRHLSLARMPDDESESGDTRRWIDLAIGLDRISKILINHCLASAAELALDKSKEWVRLAEAAGMDSFETLAIRIIDAENRLTKKQDLDEEQRSVLADRKAKLDAFVSLSSMLAKDIGNRLEQLPEPGSQRVEEPKT